MTSLRQLQRRFAATLVDARTPLQDGLVIADKLPCERLLNVYRNNSRASLRAALVTVYPIIQKLVGREFFSHLADHFVQAYPLKSGSLQCYGQYLPDFLGDFEPALTLPYIADVARIELACHLACLALPPRRDAEAIWGAHLPIQSSDLQFSLAPACFLISSTYPVFSIWKVNQDEYLGDAAVSLDEGQQDVLVMRFENRVELWRLKNPDTTFVQTLARGVNLGATVATMIELGYQFDLKKLLLKYVSSGCLVVDSLD